MLHRFALIMFLLLLVTFFLPNSLAGMFNLCTVYPDWVKYVSIVLMTISAGFYIFSTDRRE